MKAYIILGTTGAFIFKIKDGLARIVKKPIEVRTLDKPDFSSTTFEFEAESPKEAKVKIGKAFNWLIKQPWYFDDSKLAFTASGLKENDDDSEWYCEECGEDIDKCECLGGQ